MLHVSPLSVQAILLRERSSPSLEPAAETPPPTPARRRRVSRAAMPGDKPKLPKPQAGMLTAGWQRTRTTSEAMTRSIAFLETVQGRRGCCEGLLAVDHPIKPPEWGKVGRK